MNEQKCKIARRVFKYYWGDNWKPHYKQWKKVARKWH